jgi:alcohol dehydrogenase class IV
MSISRFSFPTIIHFGPGARAMVKDHLAGLKFSRPLIVTDRGVAGLPMFTEWVKSLAPLKTAVFSEIWGNPVKGQVTAGVQAYRAADCDSIIGIGGGAALDVAKAIALMIHHPGDLFDYEDEKPGGRPIDQPIPYWVALPTTSGTGSEVGRSAVISDEKTHIKKIIFHPTLLAKTVFADPEWTLGLPANITAATGMDALTHCVEAYLAKGYHPIADGIALEGLRLASQHLVNAVKNPKDIEARAGMMMSSMMGAIAFQKGLGLTHSCAHALGTVVDMHHGLANGIMIDHALAFNTDAVPGRFQIMAQTVGLKDATPTAFLRWLSELKEKTGIAKSVTAAGVSKDKLDELVKIAFEDSCHGNNPKPVKADDFRKIFTAAFA